MHRLATIHNVIDDDDRRNTVARPLVRSAKNEFVILKKQPTKLHNRTRPARTVCTVLPVTAHLNVNTLLFFLHIFFRRWRWTFWRSMNRIRSWSNTAACQQTLMSLTCLSSSPQNSVIALQYGMIRVPVPRTYQCRDMCHVQAQCNSNVSAIIPQTYTLKHTY